MNDPQANSPRQRLQALLAIPERQRTDEQWDEINELEILLAPENRRGAPQPGAQQQQPGGGRHNNPSAQRPAHGGGGGRNKRWSRGRNKPGR